jgi:two-component system LytT family response regulator
MNNAFTCIIIDDEEYAIGLLSESIKGLYSNLNIIGCYRTWKDGLEAVRSQNADIIFLDISIGGKNGMDILKIIPSIESEIIFVTAYSEYALEAFKYSATGYIVKPVGDEALGKAINKAIERIKNRRLATKAQKQQQHLPSKIGIPSGKGISYFSVEDIIYFEAVNNYTKVVMKTTEITSSYNIGKYKAVLDDQPFYHVHRSYIVNLNFVTRYEAVGLVIMSNKKEIPVSRNAREEFLKLFTSLQAETD